MAVRVNRSVWLAVLAAALAGCGGGGGADNAKTEALPADGGDLGKAWLAFHAAMKAGDVEASKRYLDGARWTTGNKKASWFQQFAEGEADKPMGGRVHGDRATLFLDASDPESTASRDYRHVNATRDGDSWRFDNPHTFGSSFSLSDARDCSAGAIFPCGVETAPPGQVGGTVENLKARDGKPATELLVDGFAVQMVPTAGAAPTATRVVLSAHGINPAALALSTDPGHAEGWLGWPVLHLDIAADGKSAELEYYGGNGRQKTTVTAGLTLDANAPGRVRGRIQAEIPEAAKVDAHFDFGVASTCRKDDYPC